jgi:hypothetical protein
VDGWTPVNENACSKSSFRLRERTHCNWVGGCSMGGAAMHDSGAAPRGKTSSMKSILYGDGPSQSDEGRHGKRQVSAPPPSPRRASSILRCPCRCM